MNRYRCTASIQKYWVAEKSVTFEVTAETAEAAQAEAYDQAADKVSFSVSFDAEHYETETNLNAVELIEGTDGNAAIPRCDRTADMFQVQP